MIQYARDGKVALLDKGQQALFLRRCIEALRALAANPAADVKPDVAAFLAKKSHIAPTDGGQFELTDKGRESLANIDTFGV
jgi:hypothetical protein